MKRSIIGRLLVLTVVLMGCNKPQKNSATSDAVDDDDTIQWLSYDGRPDAPHIVLITGDEEYRSEEALPQLAKILSQHHGFRCTVLFAQDPARPGIVDPNYPNHIPGLEHLRSADLMILFTRFRTLPDDEMQHINAYLEAGKPVIGLRTATHAFLYRDRDVSSSYRHFGNFYEADDEWIGGFGRLVLGEKWIAHHGTHGQQSTRGVVAPGAQDHPILHGIEKGAIWGPTDVYSVRLPLPGDAQVLVLGQTVERQLSYDEEDPRLGMRPADTVLPAAVEREKEGITKTIDLNDPMMPIAWIKSYQLPGGVKGTAVTSTIGASTDLLEQGTRRLLVNAAFYLVGEEVPSEANVEVIGAYTPTRFAFHEDVYWDEKGLKVSDLR